MNLLENKIVVIAGGCGQIGYATASRLAAQGAKIFSLVRKDPDTAQAMMNLLPNSHLNHRAILASITNTAELKQAAEEIRQCDILINAAGITKSIPPSKIDQYTDEMFDEIMINNLRGPFATIREFSPLLKQGKDSLIVNITSAAGVRSSNSNLAYGASKAGLELLTKSLSKVLAPNVRVVAICPGYLEKATSGAVKPAEFNQQVSTEIPLGRVGTGDDVAAVIESLATTMKYITGSTIMLDGGRLA
jgi:NAD(P)-dependent dehydrogenase (short-subunit alcohol dehydrogenase family)